VFVSCVCCACCVGSGLCDGLMSGSEESYGMRASVADLETSKRGSFGPISA